MSMDSEKKVKYSKLAEGVERASSDKKYVKNADVSKMEVCYTPMIESMPLE